MSKPSRRANREVIKQKRKERKKAAKQLLQMQRAKGLAPVVGPSISNAKKIEYKLTMVMTLCPERYRRRQARLRTQCV